MIDDLHRCAPEKVVTVLEAVHLLFDFEMFAVLVAVDTRWLDQSLRIRYRQLLGKDGAPPSDYLEKIIQIPLHLMPLDEDMVRRMIGGLTGARDSDVDLPRTRQIPSSTTLIPGGAPLPRCKGQPANQRPRRDPLPGEVLRFTRDEAITMSAAAPLTGKLETSAGRVSADPGLVW
jgi:KAP family P-loop domain